MPDVRITIAGDREIEAAFRSLRAPRTQARFVGPGLLAGARKVSDYARQPDFGFRDRTGRLRRSIRARRVRSRAGRGRGAIVAGAAAIAGGPGARQAYLVEAGHRRARPTRYLRRALIASQGTARAAMMNNLRRRWPAFAASLARRAQARRLAPRTVAGVRRIPR